MVSSSNNASSGTPVTETPNVTSLENEKNFHASVPNDGIATVSIIDGVQKEPHLNGGGSSGAMSVNELSPRLVSAVCLHVVILAAVCLFVIVLAFVKL